jgi:hypothetical protein
MRITANYGGTCTECKGRYAAGEAIDWVRGRKGSMHWECAAAGGKENGWATEPAPAVEYVSPEMQAVLDARNEDHGDWLVPSTQHECRSVLTADGHGAYCAECGEVVS